MSDDFEDLRATLKRSADDFRPVLDPSALAAAGRRQRRRRTAAVGLTGVGVLVIAAALVLPAMLPAPSVVPAVPAPAATTTPSASRYPVIKQTVATADWKTFANREFPVTFSYPADWSLDGDGCDRTSCVLFVQPPEGTGAAPIELIRNGFAAEDTTGGSLAETSKVEVLGAVPEVAAWSAETGSAETQALVVRHPAAKGGVDDYGLATAGAPAVVNPRLSIGKPSNWPEHPERVVMFSTNTGNTGGTFDKAGRDTVVAILASTRPNPDFDPTRPTPDVSGGTVIKLYDQMSTPALGTVTPDASWKTLSVKAANLTVRYPSTWKVVDGHDGILWITAPGGYIIDLLTNMPADGCESGRRVTSEGLGQTTLETGDRSPGSGPVEIRWENSGEFPVWVGLTQRSTTDECFQDTLDFGGPMDVYLGSADNSSNPSQTELEQAVAILASAAQLT